GHARAERPGRSLSIPGSINTYKFFSLALRISHVIDMNQSLWPEFRLYFPTAPHYIPREEGEHMIVSWLGPWFGTRAACLDPKPGISLHLRSNCSKDSMTLERTAERASSPGSVTCITADGSPHK